MNRYGSLAVLLCAAASVSCGGYEKNAVQDITAPRPSADIRFFNFGVNAPGVNFYAGDTKLTAISATSCTSAPANQSEACTTAGQESTTGVTYGGVGSGGLYSGITAGQHTLSGRIAAATDKGLAVSNVTTAIEDGKHYSFFQSGIYNTTTKSVDAFVVEDPFPPEIDWSVALVRFVNAIYNANPMTLYATDATTGVEFAVGGAVAYKSAGAFTALPPGTYNLTTRYVGASTTVLLRNGVGFSPGRVYTITARGDITVASTSTTTCVAANRTCLDNTVNR